jgi:hypothetical protein
MNSHLSLRDEGAFPASCPSCGEQAGMPHMAGTTCDRDRIRVGMRCDRCHNEWHFEMPTLRRKDDRRSFLRRAS